MRIAGIFSMSALAASALVAGCTAPPSDTPGGSFPEEPYEILTTDDGAFVLEVRTAPHQPPTRGRTEVELRITDAEGEPLDGVALTVVPFMPDMAHASSSEPEVEPLGDGRYEVGPIDMVMSGRWELLTTIEGPVRDSAKVAFEIE